jgi:hypothetical protein
LANRKLRSIFLNQPEKSLISKFANVIPEDAPPETQRMNRRHTIVGLSVNSSFCSRDFRRDSFSEISAFQEMPSCKKISPTEPKKLSRAAFLTNVLSKHARDRSTTLGTQSLVTLQEVTNCPVVGQTHSTRPRSSSFMSQLPENNNRNEPDSLKFITQRKPVNLKKEKSIKDSTIALTDLKRSADLRKADLKRYQSMPNGGTTGAAAAREKFMRKIGEDPSNK